MQMGFELTGRYCSSRLRHRPFVALFAVFLTENPSLISIVLFLKGKLFGKFIFKMITQN